MMWVASAHAVFYNGNDLKVWIEAHDRIATGRFQEQDFYLVGRLEGYVSAVYDNLDIRTKSSIRACYPGSLQLGQLLNIVKRYLEAHPEQWGIPANTLATQALLLACPKAEGR